MSAKSNRVTFSSKSVKVCSDNDHNEKNCYEDPKMYQNEDYTCCGRNKMAIQWFIKFTGIGGLTQTRDSDNKLSRFVWGVLFLVGLVLTMIGIVNLVIDFCRYEAITNVELGHNSGGLIFPAVTVCNQNRIHCGHLYDKIIFCSQNSSCVDREVLYCEIFVMTQCSVSMTLAHVIEYGERKWEDICKTQFDELSAEDYKEVEKIYHADDTIAPSMLYDIYMNLSEKEMTEFGHRPKDMIKECRWNGEVTDMCKDFMEHGGTKVFVPKFGVCYMINFEGRDHSNKYEEMITHVAGADHGLRLILDIQSQYYMRNGMTEKQGIGLIIEEDTRLPSAISEHIPLYPHSSTFVALTEKNFLRLESPYPSNCTTKYPERYINMTAHGDFDFGYSEKSCQSMCHNYYIHKHCGCYLPSLMEGSLGWEQFSNSSFCGYDFTKTDSCIMEGHKSYGHGDMEHCECLPECVHPIFQKQISSTLWPSDAYLPKVSARYGHDDATEPDYVQHEVNVAINLDAHDVDGVKGKLMERYMKYVSKNLLEVDVFFTSLTYENIVESPAMTIGSLLNNLGGALSLYLGVSFVAAFEVFELIGRLIIAPFYTNK